MIAYLTELARRWSAERRRRAQLRALLDKDDRILADIGLTRTDIEHALAQPITTDSREHAYQFSAKTLAMEGLR
jgi:uncharacterized protein YjiS (DUF1127 family)